MKTPQVPNVLGSGPENRLLETLSCRRAGKALVSANSGPLRTARRVVRIKDSVHFAAGVWVGL